jgi:hypothetical protein
VKSLKHPEVLDVALPLANLGTNKVLELHTPRSIPKKPKGDNGD